MAAAGRRSSPLLVQSLFYVCLTALSLVSSSGAISGQTIPGAAVPQSANAFLPADVLGDDSLSQQKFSKIIMLQDSKDALKAEAMCKGEKQTLRQLGVAEEDIPHCSLQAICTFIFKELRGFAGNFTDSDIASIQNCLKDKIQVLEDDLEVIKMEHDYALPMTPHSGRSLRQAGSVQEGPGNNPALTALIPPFQASSSTLAGMGLQAAYINPSSPLGNNSSTYVPGFKVQQLHMVQWNLDRIDQPSLPLDRQFGFGGLRSAGTGAGVTIYVVDSGIKRSHQEFASWTDGATRAIYGYNFADSTSEAEDCDGHGTHVSSTAVGRAVGVAKEAKVVAVRVLNCQGSGTVSNVVAGLNWVAQNAVLPAIVTMSLGVPQGQWSDALNQAVVSLINNYKITAIVAAGNSKVDSCTIAPANVREAITVAAVDLAGKFNPGSLRGRDELYSWDNTGSCISVFAPGVDILAACGGTARCQQLNDSAYTWASGTSMAVPHVAGLAAIYLGNNKNASPAQVKSAIINAATTGAITFGPNVLPGTPNRLINTLATGGQNVLVTASSGP